MGMRSAGCRTPPKITSHTKVKNGTHKGRRTRSGRAARLLVVHGGGIRERPRVHGQIVHVLLQDHGAELLDALIQRAQLRQQRHVQLPQTSLKS